MWYNYSVKNLIEVFKMKYNGEPLIGIGNGDIEDCWTGRKVRTYKNAKNVWFDVRPLKRFLHRKYKDVKFLERDDDSLDDYYNIEDSPKEKESTEQEYDYWSMKPIVIVDSAENNLTSDFGWRNNIESIDMFGYKEVYSLSLAFNVERSQPQRLILESKLNTNKPKGKNKKPISVTLELKKDKNKKLYFECDGKKIENLKVWLGDPWTIVLECYENGNKSDNPDDLDLDEEECVEFSLQNVTKNIKQLNSSFNKKNSNEFTIYYFVETKDSNGKYEFDSCETISLSEDKIGDEDAMLGYISVHDGKPVKTKKIKMFIKDGDCTKFDFDTENIDSNDQIELLKKNGFIELDVKRGTNKEFDKYCVVYEKHRVDTKIVQFDYNQMWSDNSSNKTNDINKYKISSEVGKKLKPIETLTPDGSYENESNKFLFDPKNFKPKCKSEESFTYTGTKNDGEELKAIKNYLNKGIDSQIWYANPNVVKDLNGKDYGLSCLEEKDFIMINVSELCNSWVWRYENNDKNLWFFQRWYAKFTLFFNISKVAKILKWKEQYKSGDDTQQIKSSLSNNDNENNKIKNENEKREEDENMAAPPGYNENNPLESNF